MVAQRNITNAMRSIYGTGNFNPRRFDHKSNNSRRTLYLWGLALFLFAIVAVVLGGMYLFGRTPDSFTGNRIAFQLIGEHSPQTVDNTSYTLRISNNEEVDLEDLELFINWPDTSKSPEAGVAHFALSDFPAASEANNTWNLGNVASGKSVDFTFSARFGGRAGSQVVLPFSLSFHPTSISSTYTVSHQEIFVLGDPTVLVDIIAPTVAASGAEVTITVRASGATLIKDTEDSTFLELTVPSGFSVSSTTPAPADKGVYRWPLSSLSQSNDAHQLSLVGTVGTDVGENIVIKAKLVRKDSSIAIVESEKQISIQNASISVAVDSVPAQGKKLQWGERIDYTLTIKNTGTYVMRNVVIRLQLPDESLWDADSLSIKSSGFYESGNVFWDATTTSVLDSLRSDASTTLTLSFSTSKRPPRGFAGVPRLVAGAEVKAGLGDQEVSVASEENIIAILADVSLAVSGRYKSPEGVVVGSGPNPPEIGQETTYSMVWTIGPSTSGLKDLQLVARLPSFVSWKDDTSLSVGEISFDSSTRNVTWKASNVPALELPFDVQFKVGVTPTSALSNTTQLMERSDFKVTDAAVGEEMEFFGNAVTLGSIE
ncbi:hypothetical protein BK004_00325 [bacterium CG10_46_32]|nr:MAG: hypothetical protein BK004_00325 [bacterium CG10_46_32]PIR56564.1 MAG: hypothetical protein COU73_00320 [Parcubacteria group bacterium CG10_big_fil_rev_8_21_14_0_10_46_32]